MNHPQIVNHSQDSKKEINLEVRKQFLREFVVKILEAKAPLIERLPNRLIEKVRAIQIEQRIPNIKTFNKIDTTKPIIPVMRTIPRRQIPIQSNISVNKFSNQQTNKPLPSITPANRVQQSNQIEQMQSLEKIRNLLKDIYVRSVECPGPGKPIIVFKGNLPQTTNILLNEDEIKAIMTEISAKTRIPLLPGLFRTALENVIVTAVISDFVGTRFVIEKKTPQQNRY